MLKQILSSLKKDFLIESSYRFSFLYNIFGVILNVLSFFYIDKLFGNKITPNLQEFGVNYFPYVLVSIAFFSYIGVGLGSFSDRIRNEQMQGTLEAIMLTPANIYTILFSLTLWNLILATIDMVIYAVLGIFLFKINFTNINLLSTLAVLILTIITFSGLGIISASFIIIFKRGNPAGWIVAGLEGLICGVYFPVNVLPAGLQFLAKCFPVTYAIKAIELAVYKGYSLLQLTHEITFLLLFSFLLIPLSLFSFKHSIQKARKDGSLGQY